MLSILCCLYFKSILLLLLLYFPLPLISPFLSFFHSVMSPCLVPLPRPSQPVLWAGPELLVLSLLSRHSPVLPWCWLRTLAANRKSKCHRDVSSGRLLLRPGRQLRWLLPHLAVLLIRGVTLQQVGSCPATRGQPGALSIYRQHTEGSQVRFAILLVGKYIHIDLITDERGSCMGFYCRVLCVEFVYLWWFKVGFTD